MCRAIARRMGVRDVRDLVCWRLAHELKCEVVAFTATGPASRDFKYRDQIRDASASATRNIAEGFGRYTPGEFARFLSWARASLLETIDALLDGRDRGYLTPHLHDRLSNLARAALKTTTNLMLAKQRDAAARKRARRQEDR